MKNQKCILVFILMIVFLLLTATFVQAVSDNPLTIYNGESGNNQNDELPAPGNTGLSGTNNTVDNTTGGNNATGNNTTGNNTTNSTPLLTTNSSSNNTTNNSASNNEATNTLPQTGIAENTTVFVFIAICIVSAIYAFVKIRNYK